MSDDKFGKAAEAGLWELTKALIPPLKLADALVRSTLPDNDSKFYRAYVDAIYDKVNEVQARVEIIEAQLRAQGREPDHLDPVAQRNLIEEFVQSAARSSDPKQADALINAAAKQTDPRCGERAVREFYWHILRRLSALEIYAIRLLGDRQVGAGRDLEKVVFFKGNDGDGEVVGGDGAALWAAYDSLTTKVPKLVIGRKSSITEDRGNTYPTTLCHLTTAGRSVLALTDEPGEERPVDPSTNDAG